MIRLSKDRYFVELAKVVAQRSTCLRRQVGCVLVDQHSHIIATGFNDVPAGAPHCYLTPCEGAYSKSGTDLHACNAIHAEQNALIQCTKPNSVVKAICTTAPCIVCTRMLLNLPRCVEILYLDEYPHEDSKARWLEAGRIWHKFDGYFDD